MNIVRGVGLILFEPTGKILLLRELKSKPRNGKYSGMLSVPLETMEERETKESALNRLIYEEIGTEITTSPVFFKEFFIELSDNQSVQLFIFKGTVDREFVARPNDTDVEYYGWMSPQDILQLDLQSRRQEVALILAEYQTYAR